MIAEYQCEKCQIVFEELLFSSEDIKKYSQKHPCKKCGKMAPRIPSVTNFKFEGKAESDPTHRQSSGVHDLDYPSLDKAVGRSANRKWKKYNAEQEARDKLRQEYKTVALTNDPSGKVVPTSSNVLEVRERAIKTLKKAKQQNPGS